MKKNSNRGFTLIELLVVIAIIGILASVVLASLNSARSKGSIAAVKASMANMRAQAELYYDSNTSKYNAVVGTAITTCTGGMFSDTNIAQMITQITAQAVAPTCVVSADGQKWAISTTLKDATTYCVDNSGWSKAGTATTAAGATQGTCL